MQVYVALCDPDDDFLVTKKREFNNWWKLKGDAKQGGLPQLVNQAGQYSFPGGKAETTDFEGNAKKEFTEETGLQFPTTATLIQKYKKGTSYTLFVFLVVGAGNQASMTEIAHAIRSGAAPNPSNHFAPINIKIEDWELADAEIVPLSYLDSYLGVHQKVSSQAQHAICTLQRTNYSQAIDWYGEMVQALKQNFKSGRIVINL
jgi:8-oxo-dGTP pyrophosphatase MutT (NUDIX family)